MKFLSIRYLYNNAKDSFLKYPLVVLSAFVAVVLSLVLVEYDDEITNKLPCINALLTFSLGVPLFFCISVFKRKNHLSANYLYGIYLLGFLFLGTIYVSFPSIDTTHNTSIPYIRYGVFNVIIHLLVSFAPYLKTKELNGFWNYNKALFLRLCTSVLYSTFIYIGLILALFSVKSLFNVEIHDELYLDIYIVIIGLFNTWFFVSGVPDDLNKLEKVREYPKGLKIFTQYILLSLLVLYLVILYAYIGKIFISWDWPKGIVSYLVSGVSVLGFFTILLIYPYGKLLGNEWIPKFSKVFYILIIPLVIVLFIALSMRVLDYGITIKRYAAITLGVWISMVCIYFIIKKDNIKFIPVSLSILLILTCFGPWGMFSVSEKSQAHRLEKILIENGILVDGKIENEVLWNLDSLPKFRTKKKLINNHILNDSLHNEVKSILDYLVDHHGFQQIRPWFVQDFTVLIGDTITHKRFSYNSEARRYMETMGIKYRKLYKNSSNQKTVYYRTKKPKLIATQGADYLYGFMFSTKKASKIIPLQNQTIQLSRQQKTLRIITQHDTLVIPLEKLKKEIIDKWGTSNNNSLPEILWSTTFTSSDLEIICEIDYVHLKTTQETNPVQNFGGTLFIIEK
ncbi:DUF4153 domain-containing protein [Wenyingzhuangia sp. 2_MG-2023]|uniref:DUF4153 domain-containing protein n=1 Tax=Wenyingzhuangia sp. 2_MG-2023 TaxID=3062639 RepID=UPI0026E1B41E|nr:DUF4153 domain-containing protein [Wenyingzhuangia sp. 2_MG-2023]MDO6736756.1 DUF4153 domain-containing protein [Wenyingzhuangia sp. 2_MG-2023]